MAYKKVKVDGRKKRLGTKQDNSKNAPQPKKKQHRTLNPQQRNFVLAYMANGHNATRAAVSAGYSPNGADVMGWWLIHQCKPVSAEIERLTALAVKKSNINATYVLGSLKEIADACKVKRIEQDKDGNDVERGVVDASGANRALELLGKNLRLFVDTLDVTRRSEFADLSDEELLTIIKKSTKQDE